jgi:hypothetical protein
MRYYMKVLDDDMGRLLNETVLDWFHENISQDSH